MVTDRPHFSRFQTSTKAGKKHITGQYHSGGATFSFYLNEQSDHSLRGQISLLDPKDGSILQLTGRRRREKERKLQLRANPRREGSKKTPDSVKAVRSLYIHANNEAKIKDQIKEAAIKLYRDFGAELQDTTRAIPVPQMTLWQAVVAYFDESIAGANLSPVTIDRKKRDMMLLTSRLADLQIPEISQGRLKTAFSALGGKAGKIFRMADRFFDFIIFAGYYQGSNPFRAYLAANNQTLKAAPDQLMRAALRPRSLTQRQEQLLMDHIISAPADDVQATGILLIRAYGITAKEACNLKWSDLVFGQLFDGPSCQLRRFLTFFAGHTQDYTKPCAPVFALQLARRYSDLSLAGGDLINEYILSIDGKRLSPKRLTQYCRSKLLEFGVNYGDLAYDRSLPDGAGVRLLIAHYKHCLMYRCGLRKDGGALKFLLGQSLAGNTTADHYRSFTDRSGQEWLQMILNRDREFDPPISEPVHVDQGSSDLHATITSDDPRRFTRAKISIDLQPGQHITLNANCYLHGDVDAKVIPPPSDPNTLA